MKRISILFLSVLSFSIILTSCRKEKQLTDASEIMKDNDESEVLFSEIFNEINNTNDNYEKNQQKRTTAPNELHSAVNDSCATAVLSWDTDSIFLKKVVVTYDNCEINGRTWSGTLTWEKDGRWFREGSKTTVTPSNFTIEGYRVEGTKVVTTKNVSLSTTSPFVIASFDVEVDADITTPDGGALTWNSSRNGTWTLETSGFYYRATGTASGTNRDGIDYTVTINEALTLKAGCRWINDGKFTLTSSELPNDVEVDYGDGTCDNKAVVTMGRREKEVEL